MTAANALVLRTPSELALAGPIGSFDAYVDTVSRIPVLSREDELELATRFHRDGELDAARKLVLSHLRFVVHIARGYTGYGLPVGDLIQEGNVGLMKAVKRFDPDVGVRLVSFAVPRRAKGGLYTVRVAMRDLEGRTFSASRSIRIPG